MKRNLSAEETRENWMRYYASLKGDEKASLFKEEFGKYTYTHTWYNSIRTIIELTHLRDKDVVLEAGSGWGRMVLGLAERFTELDITLMDLSKHALSIGGPLIGTAMKGNTIEWIEGSVEEIPLLDNKYDVVYSARVFQHLTTPAKGTAEIVRVLKPGGRFVVFLQNKLCPLNARYYSRLYTPRQVRRWFDGLQLREFRVRSMDFYPGFLCVIALRQRMWCERVLESIPILNLFGGKVVAWGRK
jgi:SAM-dependent methyltransferase